MQRKDLALRVLSTAAIMSIVTSIAAPAFADIYYIGNGDINVETKTDENGEYVQVTQGGTTYKDESGEIVIKDGTSEKDATLKEEKRAEGTQAKPAVAPAAGAATLELEAAGTAAAAGPAAGESQPDPDDAFNLSEEEEDSEEGKDPADNPTDNPAANPTDDPTANSKKDVVFELDPAADPEPEQQATKLTLSAAATPAAKTPEATLADPPATTNTPVEGSAKNPTANVIKVINNWVDDATKELKIRLSNVNIKVEKKVNKAAMDVSGSGRTKIELDGQNVLDSSGTYDPARYQAGLRKQGEGTLIITDETNDEGKKITTPKSESDTSGRLTAKGADGNGAAGIGGSAAEGTKNITIEGYATVHAAGGDWGAGIGGGGYYGAEKPGDAENIIIQGYATVDAESGGGGAGIGGGYAGNAKNIIIRGHSKVKATACNGAAIGGGSAGWGNSYYGGSAKGIVICDYATVAARSDTGHGAAIGAAGDNGNDTEAEVTIGTAGATAEQEDVHVTATGFYGSAIGNGAKDTKVTIQGHSTIRMESIRGNSTAIGSKDGNVEVNIKDNVTIDAKDEGTSIRYEGGGSSIGGEDIRGDSNRKVVVNIDGGTNGKVKIGDGVQIFGKYGAISGTEVKIGNNVLLKMKPWESPDDKYINVKGTEAAVGTRNNPAAGGLVNTIGDNTELWYYKRGVQHKIVHGKNVCTKNEINRQEPTCTEEGWVKYGCTYESDRHATAPEHIDEWTETIPALGHDWKDNGDANHICDRDHVTAAHTYGEWTTVKEATCTAAGEEKHTCSVCGHEQTRPIPATGHHWKDNGDGTHTCPDCGATEGQPVNTNSALELRVVDAEGMDQPFTVSQNGTLRTYTGAYDTATLTGDLNTLRYLQDHGAQTIQFVTNGQTSSFDINDLLAQGSGSEVFYLTHRGAEEPTLLLVEADHSELVKD
ncbi:MAG: hypothetical protein ACLT79_09160 [Faecalibacterium prausnitzii]